MANLSDEDLLFLSNLMHIKEEGQFKNIWNKKNVDNKSSIGEMLENIDTDKLKDSDITYDGEISGSEWAAMIEKVKDNPQICNLKLVDMDIDDKKALSVCLHNDETGETYVVFRGTSAGEWPDNFEGGYKADTEQQRRALAFVERQNFDNITVVGHSKGGNKAKYTAILSDKVDRCVSFDGQGFSAAFYEKYGPLIEQNKSKINCYALDNDFVNILMSDVYENKTYVDGHGVENFKQNHSPNSLFNDDWGFDATGQSYSMSSLHCFINYIVNTSSDDEAQKLMDYLGGIVNMAMGKKPPEYTESYTEDEMIAYIFDKDNAEQFGTLAAYIYKFDSTGVPIEDILASVLWQGDYGGAKTAVSKTLAILLEYFHQRKNMRKFWKPEEIQQLESWLVQLGLSKADFTYILGDGFWGIAINTMNDKINEIPDASIKYYSDAKMSNIIRDFSEDMRETLINLVKQIDDESFWDFGKWDIWYRIEQFTDRLNISQYKENINEYHRKIFDINGTTEKQLETIFEEIDDLDSSYAEKFAEKTLKFEEIYKEVEAIMS